MPNKHATLAALKAEVTAARTIARREARKDCGPGFLRSRGAEFVFADAQGNKLSEGGGWEWDGTRKGLAQAMASMGRYPATYSLSLEGGWDWAATMADMKDGAHDPFVSEWVVTVWTADEQPQALRPSAVGDGTPPF